MPTHSSTTIGLKSRKSASLHVAPTHWFVSTPVMITVSAPSARRICSRLVWKNADRRVFSTIQSSGRASSSSMIS